MRLAAALLGPFERVGATSRAGSAAHGDSNPVGSPPDDCLLGDHTANFAEAGP